MNECSRGAGADDTVERVWIVNGGRREHRLEARAHPSELSVAIDVLVAEAVSKLRLLLLLLLLLRLEGDVSVSVLGIPVEGGRGRCVVQLVLIVVVGVRQGRVRHVVVVVQQVGR